MRAFTLVASLLLASTVSAQMDVHDGTWWNQLAAESKAYFLFGFVEGMQLGREFATLDGINGTDIKMWVKDSDDSFVRNYNATIGKTSGTQIMDGLDAFYKDFRNRSIQLPFAVMVVAKQINGTPQADIDKLIEDLRKKVRQ